ncbi:MAG: phenylalanine--tRNA ligase subunit beta [Deltaproteobacteria bacterium]|nr:phenylalanine--tRNA ligase subunit beta [Deltaproteobacteria bacterium]
MEISLNWLSEFVELPELPQLVQKLTAVGIEVEAVRDSAAKVKKVIVGLIEECDEHPNANRLHVCKVFDGKARHQVVCGASNVTVGMRAPFAPIGAQVPAFDIEPRLIRGIESAGMLCSRADLGLESSSEGLWDLGNDAEIGSNVLEIAGIGPSITLGITPNRPDLLSHIGVAREIAAATGKKLKLPSFRLTEKGPEIRSLARVIIDDTNGCKRYVARVVRHVKVGPSPKWLINRIEQAGMRSINNIVDATNYVLLEMGQPLHAFDISQIASEEGLPTLHVRHAQKDEQIKTLDGNDIRLGEDDLLIADSRRALALAGVMGGQNSEVTATTTTVLLESAYFDPARVRCTAKRHAMRTESSMRFERGCDPGAVIRAIDRCAQLLVEIAEGEVAKGYFEVAAKLELTREVPIRFARVKRLLGIELNAETIVQLLEPLEIRVAGRTEAAIRVIVPSFRPDLMREVDIIEELARRYGYDKIPERLPDTGTEYYYDAGSDTLKDILRARLIASSCSEVVTFGFGNPAIMKLLAPEKGEPLKIINPLGEELSALRTSLLPGLLNVLSHNQRFGQKDIRIFEIGSVFSSRDKVEDEDPRDRDLPQENLVAGLLICGGRYQSLWYERGENVDFSDLSGIIEDLSQTFQLTEPIRSMPATKSILNPYCSATISLEDRAIGYAGQLLPEICEQFDICGPVYVAEIELASFAALRNKISYKPLPKYPKTRRDIAIIAPCNIPAEKIRAFLLQNAGGKLGSEVIEQVRLFDVYKGKPISDSHVSLAFAIDYRSRERTLTDSEVSEAFNFVQDALKKQFQVEVRSAS